MKFRSLLQGLLFSTFFCLLFFLAPFARAATLAVSPTSGTVSVGNNLTVSIILNTAGVAVAGVDIYSLHFNPAVLQVVSATTTGVQIAAGTLLPVTEYNAANNSTGVIQFSQTSTTATSSNFNGTGTLATVTFTAIAAGTSSLTFDFTAGSTNQCDVAVLYSNALTAVTNGSYTVGDTTPPTAPTNVTASSTSSSGINLSWTASTDNVGVTGYQVFRCSGASCTPTVQVATTTTNSFADSGLTPSTSYSYNLKAFDAAGNLSVVSTTATAVTAALPAPVISAILASGISQTGATITWTTNLTSDSQVVYGLTTAYGSSSTLNSTLVTSHSVSLSGLSPGTVYHYSVYSRSGAGVLSTSADSTFTTQSAPDTTAPNVSITSPTAGTYSGTITLSATASDPVVAGQVTSGLFSVTILVDGTVVASSTSATVSASLDTTTLTNATHTITATAKDNAGNVGNASAITITVYNLGNATRYPRKITLSGLEDLSSVPANTQVIAYVLSGSTVLETQNLSPDASSDYTVTFLSTDPQTVNIRVKVNGYLSQLLTSLDTTVNSATVISVPTLSAGDFNNDNTVNSLDYSLMNTHWLQNYPTADINADGIVNSLDFAVLENNFNKSGQ
jgi:hypothetical protein